jgi:hypothetical protein
MADNKTDKGPQTSTSELHHLIARPPHGKSLLEACIEQRRIFTYSSCNKQPKHFRQTSSFLDQCNEHEGTAKACHIQVGPGMKSGKSKALSCPECAESDVSPSSDLCNAIHLHQIHFDYRSQNLMTYEPKRRAMTFK